MGRLEPEIWTTECRQNEAASNTPFWHDPDPIKPALKLDRNAIEIYEIKGVDYRTFRHQVKHKIVPEKITSGKLC